MFGLFDRLVQWFLERATRRNTQEFVARLNAEHRECCHYDCEHLELLGARAQCNMNTELFPGPSALAPSDHGFLRCRVCRLYAPIHSNGERQ